ncbi:hypothetical protein A0128_16135 [Leptospira tipperaryensis]|uniref:Uncharacterized protein n=1 Tax=Leptospira tipperaryensis TaxID=2564040 RepID=A0A1D7V073_9LEPT|nr:hypothetical protein A0128_16135 [Leptospira tipperaryensis]
MRKLEFCDREKFPEFFPPPLPSTQDQGGARCLHGRIVGIPTGFSLRFKYLREGSGFFPGGSVFDGPGSPLQSIHLIF